MAKDEKHILLIEDDVDLCNAMLSGLHNAGYVAYAATELREATFKIKNEKYACILLDMRLGENSGSDLVHFIRERKDAQNTNTPILVISGHLDRPLLAKLKGQVQGALVKPFSMDALLENIKKLVK